MNCSLPQESGKTLLSGVRRCFGVGGLRIDNSVPIMGYARQNLGGSGGILQLPPGNLHFHIFLERFWCILSILLLVDKIISITNFRDLFLPFCWAEVYCDTPNKSLLIQNT